MTLFAGWMEKGDRAVAFQIIEPRKGPGTRPFEEAGDRGSFPDGLALITPLDLPKGTHLLIYFPSQPFSGPWVMGAEAIDTVPLRGSGRFRSELLVLFVQEAPALDKASWPS